MIDYSNVLIAVDMHIVNGNYVIKNHNELFEQGLMEVVKNKEAFLENHGIFLADHIEPNEVTIYYTSSYGYIHECDALDLGHEKYLFWGKMYFTNIVYFIDGDNYEHLSIDPLFKE